MNLDLDTLREMISSTLQEITTESLESTEAEENAEKAAKELQKAAAELAADTEQEKDQLAAKQDAAAAEEERKKNLSPEPPTPSVTAESFQITKGRLRQIIAEELISAKKQGIL
jgi:hypothetical protein